jgi:uncharacterized protein YrrD
MAVADNLQLADALIGMPVLSRVTGNKLGEVHDLILDPMRGELLGLWVRMPDGALDVMDYREVFSFGRDAVMAIGDDSVIPSAQTPLAEAPCVRRDIAGARVVTEGGTLLGQVANVYVHLTAPPLLAYEVRESLLDKLLGRGLFISASVGRALSHDSQRIIVPEETGRLGAASLEELAGGRLAELIADETVVRGRVGEGRPD